MSNQKMGWLQVGMRVCETVVCFCGEKMGMRVAVLCWKRVISKIVVVVVKSVSSRSKGKARSFKKIVISQLRE